MPNVGDEGTLHDHTGGTGAMPVESGLDARTVPRRTKSSGASLVVMKYEASDPADVGLLGPDAGALASDPIPDRILREGVVLRLHRPPKVRLLPGFGGIYFTEVIDP
ncbi:MAG: hypothetical protein ACR2M4_02595 [Actinomycetota bacterium]